MAKRWTVSWAPLIMLVVGQAHALSPRHVGEDLKISVGSQIGLGVAVVAAAERDSGAGLIIPAGFDLGVYWPDLNLKDETNTTTFRLGLVARVESLALPMPGLTSSSAGEPPGIYGLACGLSAEWGSTEYKENSQRRIRAWLAPQLAIGARSEVEFSALGVNFGASLQYAWGRGFFAPHLSEVFVGVGLAVSVFPALWSDPLRDQIVVIDALFTVGYEWFVFSPDGSSS